MSEMVDKVAEAIALAGNGGTWDNWYNESQKEFHRRRARAAIEAMREPTQAMIYSADVPLQGDYFPPDETWERMINEALK